MTSTLKNKFFLIASALLIIAIAVYPYTRKNTLLIYLACLCAYPLLKITFRATLKTPVAIAAIALLVWFIISASMSPHAALGFHYLSRTADKLLLILFLPALFLSTNTRKIVFLVFLISALLCAFLIQESWSVMAHTFGKDAQAYSVFFGLSAACFLHQTILHTIHSKKNRYHASLGILFFIAFAFMAYTILFVNAERIGFIIFLACCVFILSKQLKSLAALFVIIIFVTASLSILLNNQNSHRLNSIYNAINPNASNTRVSSPRLRLLEYQYALKLSLDHPFVGYGLGNYADNLKKHYPEAYKIIAQGGYPNRIENSFLFILVQTGLIGCLLYIALIILGYWQIVRYSKGNERLILETFLLAYFLANMTAPQWINHYIALLFTFPVSVGIANGLNDALKRKKSPGKLSPVHRSLEDK